MLLQRALESSACVTLYSAYGCPHEFFAHDALLDLSEAGLTRYAKQLHHQACLSQESAKISECNSKGLCKSSIHGIYIIGRVATILHCKNRALGKHDLGYTFNSTVNRGDGPANAIDEIFHRLIHSATPEDYRKLQEE